MKKSHRKDVIIARVIFTAICLALLAVIVSVVVWVRGRNADEPQTTQQTEVVNVPPVTENTELPPVTEVTGTQETQVQEPTYVWTSTGVNLRAEPNTDGEILAVLEEGAQLEFIGEEDGWVEVSCDGQQGYVYGEYVTWEQ